MRRSYSTGQTSLIALRPARHVKRTSAVTLDHITLNHGCQLFSDACALMLQRKCSAFRGRKNVFFSDLSEQIKVNILGIYIRYVYIIIGYARDKMLSC